MHQATFPFRVTFVLIPFVAGAVLLWEPVFGQDKGKGEDRAQDKRTVYVVKHGTAADLATALSKHFKDAADVQVLPQSPSNCLLIRARPDVFNEIIKLVAELDRRPHQVAVEIIIVDFPLKRAAGGKLEPAGKEVPEPDFNGPIEAVTAKLASLKRTKQLSSMKHIQLTAVENQPSSVVLSEVSPYVTGLSRSGTGEVHRSFLYRNTGTKIDLKLWVTSEQVVRIDMKLDYSRARVDEDGIPIGNDEKGKPIYAPEFPMTRMATQVDVPSGQAMAVKGVKTESKSGAVQSVVIVTAKIVEPGERKVP
jgi:type II secretory pathway component GspD/PulD (secretin)